MRAPTVQRCPPTITRPARGVDRVRAVQDLAAAADDEQLRAVRSGRDDERGDEGEREPHLTWNTTRLRPRASCSWLPTLSVATTSNT